MAIIEDRYAELTAKQRAEAQKQALAAQIKQANANAQAKKAAAAQQQAQQKAQQQAAVKAANAAGPTGVLTKVSSGGTGTATKKESEPNVKASGLNTAVKTTSGKVTARDPMEPYQESDDVIAAREALELAQANQPVYQESQAVIDAQNTLAQLQNAKPKDYESKYAPALENILQQIMNPGQFNYEFNGDNLFKQYADMYTQRGKQAMMNTMGQAAALTGGYGNSYAQQVGQQAYDQNLTELYDRGMDLRDRAYQQYMDEQANLYNQFNTVQGAEEMDYNKYLDAYNNWMKELQYGTDRYDTERNFNYNEFRDQVSDWNENRDYYTNQYNTTTDRDYSRYQDARNFAEQQYQFDTEMKEKIRQFDASLNWDKMSTQQKYAAEYCMQVLANGSMPTAAMLKSAGLSSKDAKKMMAKKSGGGGGGGSSSSKITNGTVYYQNGQYVDANGKAININDYDTKTLRVNTNPPSGSTGNSSSGMTFSDAAMEAAYQAYQKAQQEEAKKGSKK